MSDRWPDPPPLFDLTEAERSPGSSRTASARVRRASVAQEPAIGPESTAAASGSMPQAASPAAASPTDSSTAPLPDTHPVGSLLGSVAVFDLETTGVDVENDRIVTAFVGVVDDEGQVGRTSSWIADPGIEIPDAAAAVHGVSTERARAEGRPAGEVVAEIVETLRLLIAENIPVVAYNAAFDLSLLRHEAVRHAVPPLDAPRPIIDPLVIDKAVDRYRKGKRTLDRAAEHYGVALDDAHEASADAIAAGRIAIAIAARFADELPDSLDALHDQQIVWAREQAESLTEYLVGVGRLEPSEGLDGTWPVR
ncbi:exonuclease domain-containing protein [Microbacterium halotolerans]|uniref:exonuclease domain-containing protein n=1 Tax=Microbacterium halotolerans TaxID=246613 RepID=UPI001F089F75|nr:exonuclease domain-containing protein [Microbacterium halotolerans]